VLPVKYTLYTFAQSKARVNSVVRRSGPRPRKGGFSHPAGSQRPWKEGLQPSLGYPAGKQSLPFAGKARSHKPAPTSQGAG